MALLRQHIRGLEAIPELLAWDSVRGNPSPRGYFRVVRISGHSPKGLHAQSWLRLRRN